jgi:MerR family transcriptional regulator, heat shock protein HspR
VTRLFSEEDVDRLEEVIFLTHKMGVNLAGVQMILKLEKRIKHMQGEMNKLFMQMQGQLESESERYKQDIKEQGERLVAMKKESGKDAIDITENSKSGEAGGDDWEIDYSDN